MKFIVYLVIIALLIGVVGYIGINSSKNIVRDFNLITEQTAPEIIVLGEIAKLSEILQVEAIGFALIRAEKAEEEKEEELKEFSAANQELDKKIEELESREEGHSHELEKGTALELVIFAKEIKELKEELYSAAQALIDAKKQGKTGEDILEIKEELESVEENFRKIIDARIEVENSELKERSEIAYNTANRLRLIIISTSLLAILITIALGFFISRKITNPIKQLSETVEKVSRGNFDVEIDTKTGIKEINDLARSLSRVLATMKLAVLRKGPIKRGNFDRKNKGITENDLAKTGLLSKSKLIPKKENTEKLILKKLNKIKDSSKMKKPLVTFPKKVENIDNKKED